MRWGTPIAVNGALADVLVTDFGGAQSKTVTASDSAALCVVLEYSAAAAGSLLLYLATSAGPAPEDRVVIYNSAYQTTPDTTESIAGLQFEVPLVQATRVPYSLYITKAANNANILLRPKIVLVD